PAVGQRRPVARIRDLPRTRRPVRVSAVERRRRSQLRRAAERGRPLPDVRVARRAAHQEVSRVRPQRDYRAQGVQHHESLQSARLPGQSRQLVLRRLQQQRAAYVPRQMGARVLTMAQKVVQLIIGRLLTDEELRLEFLANPRETLDALRDQGYDLTHWEMDALMQTDPELWDAVAPRTDPRL